MSDKQEGTIEFEIPHFRSPDFRPWFAMVMSTVALIVSIVAYVIAQDDSNVKRAYEAQTKSVKDLSQQVQDLHQEVGALRGYAEGQAKSLTVAVPVKPGASAVPASSFNVQIPMRVVPFKDVKPDEWTSPVPVARPALKPVEVPAWDTLKKDATEAKKEK